MPPRTEAKALLFELPKSEKKSFRRKQRQDVKNKAGIGLSLGETPGRPERGQHAVTEALIQKLQSSQEAFAKDPIGVFCFLFIAFAARGSLTVFFFV